MKKLIFIFSLLVAAVCVSAQPGGGTITVTGIVTDISTGAPIADRSIYAIAEDPIFGVYAQGVTNAAGEYTITLSTSASIPTLIVFADNPCSNLPAQVTVPVVNNTATADLQLEVCSTGSCAASGYAIPTTNQLEMQFWGSGFNPQNPWDSIPPFYTCTWNFGDGTVGSGSSPVHTYAQPGTYTVVLTASSADCTATFTFQIVVEYMHVVTVSGTVLDPNGAPVPFWSVQVGNQFVTTDENGFYTVQTTLPLSDSIVWVYSYTFCDSFPNDPINQNSIVAAPIVNDSAVANFVLCDFLPPVSPCSAYLTYYQTAPQTFAFQYYAFAQDNAPVVGVIWDFGDGSTSNEEAPVHTYTIPGIYTVLLTTTTATGCESHACDVVFSFDDSTYCPIDTFYYGCQAMFWSTTDVNPIGVADPLTILFNDISFGAVATRHWDFGDGTTSTDGPAVSHTYAAPGLYDVTFSITTLDGCESEVTMQVYAGEYPWVEHGCQALFMPFPDSAGNGFFFFDLSYTNALVQSWAWDFGDNTTSTEQNPYHQYSQPGVYTVTLTIVAADSCSSVIAFDVDTDNPFNHFAGGGVQGLAAGVSSTKEAETLSEARIAPNPVTDRINLAFESKVSQDVQVNVLNTTGKVVRSVQTSAQNGWNALQIPAADLAAGFYYVQIQNGKSTQTVKLVKADK